jgi:hypothetical protein
MNLLGFLLNETEEDSHPKRQNAFLGKLRDTLDNGWIIKFASPICNLAKGGLRYRAGKIRSGYVKAL